MILHVVQYKLVLYKLMANISWIVKEKVGTLNYRRGNTLRVLQLQGSAC
jgi:hypothetical protein